MSSFFSTYLPREAADLPRPNGGMFLWLRLRIETHPDFLGSCATRAVSNGHTNGANGHSEMNGSHASPGIQEIADRVFQTLIKHKILTVPGQFFRSPRFGGISQSVDQSDEAKKVFVRCSFAGASPEEMEEGVKRIAVALKEEWRLA